MSDGDIFKAETSFYLQLGELHNSDEAPYAVFFKNEFDQTSDCDPILPRFYIPKGAVRGLPDDYYFINLAAQAILLLPTETFHPESLVAQMSYVRMNAINSCAITRSCVKKGILPYLRTDRH